MIVSGLNHYAHSSKTKINSKTDASPGPPGEVEFKKLSEEQLKEFRVIQEDEIQNAPLTTPQNNTVYKVDGFYQKQFTDNKYWYKIGNGNRVTVSYSNGGYVFKTITFSNWGYFSSVGYLPKQEDHWYRPTVNSPYGNPFDLNNFKK